ncbi:MAG: hypothetical protein ACTHJ0_09130, partial [Flavipsychrobacter sp.]
MQKKAILLSLILTVITQTLIAQTTYLPLNTEDYHVLDRLETRSGRLSDSLFLFNKPEMRSRAVDFLEQQGDNARYIGLSAIDRSNISRMISENGEWTPDENGAEDSKHPWFNTFYQKQFDFVHVHTNNFFLVVNPVISAELYREQNNSNLLFWSARGAEVRG